MTVTYDHDVRGFDIAMHYAVFMRIGQPLGNLGNNIDYLFNRHFFAVVEHVS